MFQFLISYLTLTRNYLCYHEASILLASMAVLCKCSATNALIAFIAAGAGIDDVQPDDADYAPYADNAALAMLRHDFDAVCYQLMPPAIPRADPTR
jgi:hypothetical protein